MSTPIAQTNVRVDEVRALYGHGDLEAARQICRQAITAGEIHPDLFHLMGLIDLRQGRVDSAVEQVRRAVRADGCNPNYLNTLGVALKSCGRLDEAAACLKQALALQPEFPKAYNNLGLVLKAKGQRHGAVAYFRRAIKQEADFCQAHYNVREIMQHFRYPGNALDRQMEKFRASPAAGISVMTDEEKQTMPQVRRYHQQRTQKIARQLAYWMTFLQETYAI